MMDRASPAALADDAAKMFLVPSLTVENAMPERFRAKICESCVAESVFSRFAVTATCGLAQRAVPRHREEQTKDI